MQQLLNPSVKRPTFILVKLLICNICLIQKIGFVRLALIELTQEIDDASNGEDVGLCADLLGIGNFRRGKP